MQLPGSAFTLGFAASIPMVGWRTNQLHMPTHSCCGRITLKHHFPDPKLCPLFSATQVRKHARKGDRDTCSPSAVLVTNPPSSQQLGERTLCPGPSSRAPWYRYPPPVPRGVPSRPAIPTTTPASYRQRNLGPCDTSKPAATIFFNRLQ